MQNLEDIERAITSSGKASQLQSLANSPEGQRLAAQLDAKALEKAAKSGNAAALQTAMRQILSTQEGRALAEKLSAILK